MRYHEGEAGYELHVSTKPHSRYTVVQILFNHPHGNTTKYKSPNRAHPQQLSAQQINVPITNPDTNPIQIHLRRCHEHFLLCLSNHSDGK